MTIWTIVSINFRDALTHYKKLCDNFNDNNEVERQISSIEEHLFRGLKDSIIHLCFILTKRLNNIIENKITLKKIKTQIRKSIHNLKNLNLDLRFISDVYGLRGLSGVINDLYQIISQIIEFFNKTPNLKIEYLKESVDDEY